MQGKVNKKLIILIGSVIAVVCIAVIVFLLNSNGWHGNIFESKNDVSSGDGDAFSSGDETLKTSGDEIEYTNYSLTKQVGNVEFSNIRVGKVKIKKCLFEADLENLSDKLQLGQIVNISTIDEDGEVRETFSGFLVDLPGNGKGTFKTQVLSDITYAKDFKIEVVNQ